MAYKPCQQPRSCFSGGEFNDNNETMMTSLVSALSMLNKKFLIAILIIIINCSLLLLGCTTPRSKEISQIAVGMDKSTVLDLAGNPSRTQRVKGRDLWVYIYYVDKTQTDRAVFFDNGQVVQVIDDYLDKKQRQDALHGAETLEEYTEAVEQLKKQNEESPKMDKNDNGNP